MFSCLFDDITRTGQSMKEFLNALLVSEGEEPIEEIVEMKSEYTMMPEGAIQKLGRFDVKVKKHLRRHLRHRGTDHARQYERA